jgi:hypothetical protein
VNQLGSFARGTFLNNIFLSVLQVIVSFIRIALYSSGSDHDQVYKHDMSLTNEDYQDSDTLENRITS